MSTLSPRRGRCPTRRRARSGSREGSSECRVRDPPVRKAMVTCWSCWEPGCRGRVNEPRSLCVGTSLPVKMPPRELLPPFGWPLHPILQAPVDLRIHSEVHWYVNMRPRYPGHPGMLGDLTPHSTEAESGPTVSDKARRYPNRRWSPCLCEPDRREVLFSAPRVLLERVLRVSSAVPRSQACKTYSWRSFDVRGTSGDRSKEQYLKVQVHDYHDHPKVSVTWR